MFVDASAVVAILGREPGWEALFERLSASAGPLHFSALVRFEAAQAIARLTAGGQKPTAEHLAKARDKVDRFLAEIEAEPLAVGDDIGTHAIEAGMRYGKAVGHPANLNSAIAWPMRAPQRWTRLCFTKATISRGPIWLDPGLSRPGINLLPASFIPKLG